MNTRCVENSELDQDLIEFKKIVQKEVKEEFLGDTSQDDHCSLEDAADKVEVYLEMLVRDDKFSYSDMCQEDLIENRFEGFKQDNIERNKFLNQKEKQLINLLQQNDQKILHLRTLVSDFEKKKKIVAKHLSYWFKKVEETKKAEEERVLDLKKRCDSYYIKLKELTDQRETAVIDLSRIKSETNFYLKIKDKLDGDIKLLKTGMLEEKTLMAKERKDLEEKAKLVDIEKNALTIEKGVIDSKRDDIARQEIIIQKKQFESEVERDRIIVQAKLERELVHNERRELDAKLLAQEKIQGINLEMNKALLEIQGDLEERENLLAKRENLLVMREEDIQELNEQMLNLCHQIERKISTDRSGLENKKHQINAKKINHGRSRKTTERWC